MNKDYQLTIINMSNNVFKMIRVQNIKTNYRRSYVMFNKNTIEIKLVEYYVKKDTIEIELVEYHDSALNENELQITNCINEINFIINSNCFKYINTTYANTILSNISVFVFEIIEPEILLQLL